MVNEIENGSEINGEIKPKNWKEFDVESSSDFYNILLDENFTENDFKQLGNNSDGHSYFFPTRKVPRQSSINVAEKLINGYLKTSSNHAEVQISMPPDWSKSPLNDNNWMFILHSLRWLEVVIHAYLLTKDEKWIKFINLVSENWIDENVVGAEKSNFAWNDHATSYRLRLFVYYWGIYKETDVFSENKNFNQKFIMSIYQHMLYHSEKENFHLKSNHSLEMIGAILSASHVFKNDFKNADNFFEQAEKLLEEYLTMNFSSKGYHLEQSPSYHWYVLERLLLIKDYLDHYNLDLGKVNQYIDLAWKANAMLLKPNNSYLTLGDTGLLNIEQNISRLKENEILIPDLPSDLPEFDVCEQSGYGIFRDVDTLTIFKCNNFVGPHYHDDFMSFSMFAHGSDWFVDSGYYSYNEKDPFRIYFRSGFAHNGIIINNKPIKASVEKIGTKYDLNKHSIRSGGVFEGGHAIRSFQRISKNDYLINDEVVINEKGNVEQIFHIHPSLKLNKITKDVIELENAEGVICCITQLNSVGEWQAVKGQETPNIQGWYSEGFNKKEPTFTLKYNVKQSNNINLKTYIYFKNQSTE